MVGRVVIPRLQQRPRRFPQRCGRMIQIMQHLMHRHQVHGSGGYGKILYFRLTDKKTAFLEV